MKRIPICFQSLVLRILAILFIATNSVWAADPVDPATVVNLEFYECELRQVFRDLAVNGGFQVVMDSTVAGPVSIAFRTRISAREAASITAKTYGLTLRWLPNSDTAYIGKSIPENIGVKFASRTAKSFTLERASVTTVADALTVVLPQARIKTDLLNNQIQVVASELELANVSELITRWDRITPYAYIETRIAEIPVPVWRELDLTPSGTAVIPAIYPLNAAQSQKLLQNKTIWLARQSLTCLDYQTGRIFYGDALPQLTERSQSGEITYKVEYLEVGTTLSLTPRIEHREQVGLKIEQKVMTITNQAKPGVRFNPITLSRDFTAFLSINPGQICILAGGLQRAEFDKLRNTPYQYPTLQQLFGSGTKTSSQGQMVMVVTARLADSTSVAVPSPTDVNSRPEPDRPEEGLANPDNTGVPTASPRPDSTTPSSSGLPGVNEEKPVLDLPGIDKIPSGFTDKVFELRYSVRKGDTLTAIARRYGVNLATIVTRNKLGNSGKIKPQAELVIPIPGERIYILGAGETLWRVAKRYGTTVELLQDLNQITDIRKIRAGQPIVLPVTVREIKNPQF